ncbi:hypothetical protein AAC387_Pa07g3607 [Persea americana]
MEIDSKSKRVCCVFQADPADKVWVEVKSLGDMMLFLNRKSYISISVGATGGGKVNRIGYALGFFLFGMYIEIELGNYDNVPPVCIQVSQSSVCLAWTSCPISSA